MGRQSLAIGGSVLIACRGHANGEDLIHAAAVGIDNFEFPAAPIDAFSLGGKVPEFRVDEAPHC